MMSTSGRDAPDDSPYGFGAPGEGGEAGCELMTQGQHHGSNALGGGAGMLGHSRKQRRRQRSQHGKRPRGPGGVLRPDVGTRERMFQDIEGLLRQIREQAEESETWTAEELNEFVQAVTSFTKALEAESEPLSERARGEYQRVREKLSHALRRAPANAAGQST